MSVTIHLANDQRVQVSDQRIETQPPDRIEFVAEGIITMTEGLLGEFAGTALKPSQVDLSVEGSQTITVELTAEASLRLEDVDIGVETLDTDDVLSGMESLGPTTDDSDESSDINPGAIAYTAEGTILNVPEETFEPLSGSSPTLESITFTVDDAIKSDGGSNNDVLREFTLLGYGIVIHRNGIIEIGTIGGVTDGRLP